MQFQIGTCWEDHQHRAEVCLLTYIREGSRGVLHGFASPSGGPLFYWGKSSWGGPAWPRSRVMACTGHPVLLGVSVPALSTSVWVLFLLLLQPQHTRASGGKSLQTDLLWMDLKGWSSTEKALNHLLKDPLFAGWLQWEPGEAPRLCRGPYLSRVT